MSPSPHAVFAELFDYTSPRQLDPGGYARPAQTAHRFLADGTGKAPSTRCRSPILPSACSPPCCRPRCRANTYHPGSFPRLSASRCSPTSAANVGRAALGVDVHLWIRELSRVDRAVRATAEYRWSDDGALAEDTELFLPAVYCRHCGRSGWGARLAPTGSALDVTDEAIRADHAAGGPRFRALDLRPRRSARDDHSNRGLAMVPHRPPRTRRHRTRPRQRGGGRRPGAAGAHAHRRQTPTSSQPTTCARPAAPPDAIRFLGSAVATQLSVTLSNLFGDNNLDAAEKKALMFTDSVQDAAHRAGFVQARSHSLSLRTALRGALGEGELDLDELSQAVISRAGNDPMLRYQLLPPDIVDRDEFVGFWKAGVHQAPAERPRTGPSDGYSSTLIWNSVCSHAPAAHWSSPAVSPPRCTWVHRIARR